MVNVAKMRTVTHAAPVVVSHPNTQQFVAVQKGMEFKADDPLALANPWLFTEQDSGGGSDVTGDEDGSESAPDSGEGGSESTGEKSGDTSEPGKRTPGPGTRRESRIRR